jgi:hypothetical protein
MWRVEKSTGATEDDLVEGEATTEVNEEGGYTAKSVLNLKDLGQEVEAVTLQCVAIVPGMGQDVHSELFKVEVTVLPGSPLIAGLRSGSSITVASSHSLTCSARAGNPPAAIKWLRNGVEEQGRMEHHGNNVVSHWEYVAKENDEKITCQVTNGVHEKTQATVHVNVVQPVQPVQLETVHSPKFKLLEPFQDENSQDELESTLTEEEQFEEEETQNVNHEPEENEIDDEFEVPKAAEEEPEIEVVNQQVAKQVSAIDFVTKTGGSSASSSKASLFTLLASLMCFCFLKL